jgi:hypothetical protein
MASPLPALANITLSGTPGNCTQVIIPAGASRVSIKARTSAAKLSFDSTLTDGGVIGAATYISLSADSMYEIRPQGMKKTTADVLSYFLASTVASVVVEVLVEGGPA